MIKILFFSQNFEEPSSLFNFNLLKNINKNKFSITRSKKFPSNLNKFQLILVLGYDANFVLKNINKKDHILLGLIDPRPSQKINLNKFDFFISNGIEMSDWLNQINKPQFCLPIFPLIDQQKKYKKKINTSAIKLGYHGNLIHLNSFKDKLIFSLNNLKNHFDEIELILIYNVKKLGFFNYFDKLKNVKVSHHQWNQRVYSEILIQADIGLVPGTLKINNSKITKLMSSSLLFKNNESFDDYFLRSKVTSNIGRHLVFAQLNIPIVADFTPSSLQLIDHRLNGYVCSSKESFSKTIEELALDFNLRKEISKNMFNKFNDTYNIKILSNNLKNFFESLIYDYS